MEFDPTAKELTLEQAFVMFRNLQDFEVDGCWNHEVGAPEWAEKIAAHFGVATGHAMVTTIPYRLIAMAFHKNLDTSKLIEALFK